MRKYELVAKKIEEMILEKKLKGGMKIPSIREMSSLMKVSVMTVLEAYRRLEDRNIIESIPQSGYFVRPDELRGSGRAERLPEAKQENIALQCGFVNISPQIMNILSEAGRKDVIPLGAGLPDAKFLASEELSQKMARICRNDPEGINRYSLNHGEESLRSGLSRWMRDSGCDIDPEEIIVSSGATSALLISLRAVCEPGDTVAIESPGFHGFYSLLHFLNLKSVEIPCDPQLGFSLSSLGKIIAEGGKISCVLMSSTFSNPTGSTIPDWKKEKLVKLCEKNNIPIIDDDTYGDLSFSQRRPRSLKSFSPDNVIHIGSMSKILAPGYRIGWVAGGRYREAIKRCHAIAILSVPLPNQLVISAMLQDGSMRRRIKKLRRIYEENMSILQSVIARKFPWGTCTSQPEGGHFLWVRLPEGCDAVKLSGESIKHGISIAPGNIFSSRDHYRNFIRLNCAVEWSEQVMKAVSLLGKLAEAQRTGKAAE